MRSEEEVRIDLAHWRKQKSDATSTNNREDAKRIDFAINALEWVLEELDEDVSVPDDHTYCDGTTYGELKETVRERLRAEEVASQ